MNLETFSDNFHLLADTPNGIQKLRELILQLAVQGKLVPQDPNEEPVSILLETIKSEKKKLISQGIIKKSISLPAIESNDVQFKLPKSWKWVYLDDITITVHYGYTASSDDGIKDVRFLRITDIQNNKVNWDTVPGCKISEKEIVNYLLNKGDILIARTGGTIGKSFLVDEISIKAVFASYLIRAVPSKMVFPKYTKIFLESPCYWEQLYNKSMGTGQPNVNGTALKSLKVPFPSLEEQKRIVSKVDQLMAICDELEEQQKKKTEYRSILNESSLQAVLSAEEPEEFEQHWKRICDNFDLLYDDPANIEKLRQAILQLAVQGKLVPQYPSDEPASVLVERTIERRRFLLKNKLIKKIDTESLSENEIKFSRPNGWVFIKLGRIVEKLGAGSTPLGGKSIYEDEGIKFIRSKNVWNNGLKMEDVALIPNEIHIRMSGTIVQPGDILLNITGASIGRSCIVPDTFDEGNVSQHVAIIRLIDKELRKFLHLCLISPFIQDRIMGVQVGISREGLSMSSLKEFIVPIPPLKEQRRITQKVDSLLSLCDDIENKLRQSKSAGVILIESIVNHLSLLG